MHEARHGDEALIVALNLADTAAPLPVAELTGRPAEVLAGAGAPPARWSATPRSPGLADPQSALEHRQGARVGFPVVAVQYRREQVAVGDSVLARMNNVIEDLSFRASVDPEDQFDRAPARVVAQQARTLPQPRPETGCARYPLGLVQRRDAGVLRAVAEAQSFNCGNTNHIQCVCGRR